MSNQESSLKIDFNALGQFSELELWRHKQILEGIAESANEDYADEKSVKKVFKNIKYSVWLEALLLKCTYESRKWPNSL